MSTRLNWVRTGRSDRPPVVLLHSAGLDLTFWDAQIRALREEYDVVALDLPGHGRSGGTAEGMGVDSMAAAVRDLVDDLALRRIHLVGLSLGGLVAQSLAAADPDRVAGVALIDTAARFGPAAQDAMRRRAEALRRDGMTAVLDGLFGHWFLPETLRARPELVDRATKTLLRDDVMTQAAMWETIARFDGRDRLARVAARALVVVGEHDSSSPVPAARELAAGLPEAELTVVPDAAHLSPLERPDEITRRLQAFIAAVQAGRAAA